MINLIFLLCCFSQREIENSYASNADYVHKSVLFTEDGKKRYAEQVSGTNLIICPLMAPCLVESY